MLAPKAPKATLTDALAAARMEPKTAKVGTRDHIPRLEKENPPPSSGWKEKRVRHMDLLEGRMAPGTTKIGGSGRQRGTQNAIQGHKFPCSQKKPAKSWTLHPSQRLSA